MGWIGCVRCKKFWCDFVAQTFALIAPVQPVLQLASCSTETILNAPKHNETHQIMSLASNGVDMERLLWKVPTRLRGMNFCINCTISAHFAPSFVRQRNSPKSIQTVQHVPKHEFRVQWGGSGAFVAKNSDMTSCHELFSVIAPLRPSLHQVSCGNETIPNAPKDHETHQNLSLWSNGVERQCSLRKIPTRLRGTNFFH